ncbi:inactive serine/threonine-protein kinase VRK3 isoform X2 [Megalops cyprinoides]|nr:inactive serine/threonine-protein kinase VRK3 isoform X2 [Megalops cyprinoides]
MVLNFCPHCGSRLQAGFKFCPACGEQLPVLGESEQLVSSATSPEASQAPVTSVTAQLQSPPCPEQAGEGPVSARSPLRRMRKSAVKVQTDDVVTPPKKKRSNPPSVTTPSKSPAAGQSPQALQSPRKRQASLIVKQEEEVDAPVLSAPSPRSPAQAKGKAKRARPSCAPEPLQAGDQLTDTAGRKWQPVKLLSQSEAELVYGVKQLTPGASSVDYKHILKLAAKDGRIFNEQNFLQRAAKSTSVEKWMKMNKRDFLGIPVCVGFGLHADIYRFLIFPYMGVTLQSLMKEGEVLSEKAVLQLACRILDVLEYIHENEYVHADIHSENIYINPANTTQVYLAGYCHAFRYCPNGRHVEYREKSRTPHEGALEFISVDSHKGAGPSRRSDLQTLGYCMLHWLAGALPWTPLAHCPSKVTAEKERYLTDVQGLLSQCFGRRKVSGAVRDYLLQVMSLQYTEEPDYQQLRDGLHKALQQQGASLAQPIDLQV